MNLSSEGRDLLARIDERLSTEYECLRMLTSFDHGDGPKGLAAEEIIKVIKKNKEAVNLNISYLNEDDMLEILDTVFNNMEGTYKFGFTFDSSKDNAIIIRILNELLSRRVGNQVAIKDMDPQLVYSQFFNIDLANLVIIMLNKMVPNFDVDMQKQMMLAKYNIIFCLKEVEDDMISNNYQPINNPVMITGTADFLCGLSKKEQMEMINAMVLQAFYGALDNILMSDAKELSVIDVVNSAVMRASMLLVDEDVASDLMHDTMNYLKGGSIPSFNERLIFDAITSRFEDEEIPRFLSFSR